MSAAPKRRLVYISERPLASIRPAQVNDKLYKPIDLDDPGIIALAESIAFLTWARGFDHNNPWPAAAEAAN